MPTPPTLVAFSAAEAVNTSGTAVTTASLTWQANDVIVALCGSEGGTSGETLNAPTTTGSGISFGAAQQLFSSAGSNCGGGAWAAVASSGSSGTFSGTITFGGGLTRDHLIGVYVWRGSAGIGNSNITESATPAGTALTPTGADGAVCWFTGDWAAASVQSFSPAATSHGSGAPGPTASPFSGQVTSTYTYYVGCLDDQTSAGSVSYGIGGSGTGPFTTVAIEVKASAVATTANAGVATATGSADPLNTSGPAYSGAASDLGGGTGSWTNPTNADGAPDSTYATWAIP